MGRLMAASVGAAAALGVVMLVAAKVGSDLTILVVGLLMSYFVFGLIGLLVYWADSDSFQRYYLWTFGSFDGVPWPNLAVFATAALVGMVLSLLLVKGMDALILGEEHAESLGVAIRPTRWGLVVGSSLLAAAVTATCGPVGFIGVAVPHLARLILGSSIHRVLLPGSILLGAIVALVADLIARGSAATTPIPINVVTSLLGGARADDAGALSPRGFAMSSSPPLLSADNLSIGFAPSRPIASSLSLALEAGEIVFLLGRNGVGKTTLLRTLAVY